MQRGERRVTVAAGSSQIVKFDLYPEVAGETGILKIVAMVPEALVFIDGVAVGKVPQEKKVSAGDHPVVVRLDGYRQFEQNVRVETGQTVTVSAELTKDGVPLSGNAPAAVQARGCGATSGGSTMFFALLLVTAFVARRRSD